MKNFRNILLSCFLLGIALPVNAAFNLKLDSEPIDRTNSDRLHSYADILKGARAAVVSVKVSSIVSVADYADPHEDFFRRFFGTPERREKKPSEEPDEDGRRLPEGIGSGVIVTADGYILTNNHVVADRFGEDADEIEVLLEDGREFKAEIIGRDEKSDIAVLKVEADNLPVIPSANSDNLEIGDVVFAIGNPFGVGLTVTQGIVSALKRKIGIYDNRHIQGYENFIQTDAAVNRGNSGGALIDSKGRLIGINSAIVSRTGVSAGISLAIPMNFTKHIMEQLINHGEVRRGFLGIEIRDLTLETAEAFGLDNTDGVIVNNVNDNSAARKAGIERGDVILDINAVPVRDVNELRLRVSQTMPGSEIEVGLVRDRNYMKLPVTLGDLDTGELRNSSKPASKTLFPGISVSNITRDFRVEYGIPDDMEGVVITNVDESVYENRGLKEGIVIREVNDREVKTTAEAEEFTKSGINKLYVYVDGRSNYIALRK